MVYRAAKLRKSTRRSGKSSRKISRKTRHRRQRGGGNTYTFTVNTPITPTSTATGFPAELGVFTPGNQRISFNNPTKQIVDIKVMNGTTPYGASSFSTSSGTKLSFQVGTSQSLVSKHVGQTIRGTTALPGAAATSGAVTSGRAGAVTIKGLAASSFGTIPGTLTFEVSTAN